MRQHPHHGASVAHVLADGPTTMSSGGGGSAAGEKPMDMIWSTRATKTRSAL
jgi:hypothetical protein